EAAVLVAELHQVLEQPDERHGRGDLLLARAALDVAVHVVAWELQLAWGVATRGQRAAKLASTLEHVLDLVRLLAWVEVRRDVRVRFQRGVWNLQVEAVAEGLEVLQRQLLHLVGGVARLEV